ncbi:hypothetical protein TTHERM_000829300 (macronuclear) [Tetrahymena thermophila SB210]|uniref:Uncharacterized protein n=1 Tax=Tetrahymena thermophila (strain SB210) TaxID=312017 RepID=W7XIW3_TETTS|nr:hypothetical protein TTHERM_000829300 [Tetrahymena thermophila SB210]EWS74976.1 hypothetical protein TTHERM_000829300 [Tetrahymena thermophila SB210]|eukprot:XP_012652475.1 hypothetical protein TTHERM_000829300 [Tetrahymena thermophila SB210]
MKRQCLIQIPTGEKAKTNKRKFVKIIKTSHNKLKRKKTKIVIKPFKERSNQYLNKKLKKEIIQVKQKSEPILLGVNSQLNLIFRQQAD